MTGKGNFYKEKPYKGNFYKGNGITHPSTCPFSVVPRAIALNGYNLFTNATDDLYVISS